MKRSHCIYLKQFQTSIKDLCWSEIAINYSLLYNGLKTTKQKFSRLCLMDKRLTEGANQPQGSVGQTCTPLQCNYYMTRVGQLPLLLGTVFCKERVCTCVDESRDLCKDICQHGKMHMAVWMIPCPQLSYGSTASA